MDSLYTIAKTILESYKGRPVKAEEIAEKLGTKTQYV